VTDDLKFSLPGLFAKGASDEEFVENDDKGKKLTRFVGGRFRPVYLITEGQMRRIGRRNKKREQARGSRLHNRKQRKAAFDAGTRRAQLAILQGNVEVTPDMRRNLTSAIERQHRELTREERSSTSIQRLSDRRALRFSFGTIRGKDLRDDVFRQYEHLLPEDYTGKRASDRG
jgi:hypothetical protein